jgi:hypothetical protein
MRKRNLCSVRVFFKRGKEKKIREIILHDLRAERIVEKS